eukprot:Gb_29036 [translate_table: standard]
MGNYNSPRLLWIIAIIAQVLKIALAASQSLPCPFPAAEEPELNFVQQTDRFWAYDSHFNRWEKIELPFDLFSCINDNCSKVGSIEAQQNKQSNHENHNPDNYNSVMMDKAEETMVISDDEVSLTDEHLTPLPVRTRMSLSVMSETAVWITGESGSIYERFWNGIQWVIAPHDLPLSAGYATSVFTVNHTFMALSEAGLLYQLKIDANAQALWVEIGPSLPSSINTSDEYLSMNMRLRSGIPSAQGIYLYFATVDGSLVELSELQPIKCG